MFIKTTKDMKIATDSPKKRIRRPSFFAFFKAQIEQLAANNRMGTARNYRRTLASFTDFREGKDLPLKRFNEDIVTKYEAYLVQRGMQRNSSSFYLRILRAVFNRAASLKLVVQTCPFSNVYTGVDRTRKRAMDEQAIQRLQQLDLSASPALALTRDLFIFSFCTRGMAFVDIAFLKKTEVHDGVISYVRRKTGQRITVKIEPCIARIIRSYIRKKPTSPYLFPVLTNESPRDAFKQYQTAIGYHNRKLKRLGGLIGEKRPLTSYVARHTWATTAQQHSIPLAVICAAMGHTSERTTRIYLDGIEDSIIDRANKKILKGLF